MTTSRWIDRYLTPHENAECALDEKRLNKLKAELQPILNHDEDQILLVSLGPEDSSLGLRIEAMGLPYLVRSRVTIV